MSYLITVVTKHRCSGFLLSDFITFPLAIFNTIFKTKCCVLLWPDAWCFLKAGEKKSYTPLSTLISSHSCKHPPILSTKPKLQAMLKEVLVQTQPSTCTLTPLCLPLFLIIIFSFPIFRNMLSKNRRSRYLFSNCSFLQQ